MDRDPRTHPPRGSGPALRSPPELQTTLPACPEHLGSQSPRRRSWHTDGSSLTRAQQRQLAFWTCEVAQTHPGKRRHAQLYTPSLPSTQSLTRGTHTQAFQPLNTPRQPYRHSTGTRPHTYMPQEVSFHSLETQRDRASSSERPRSGGWQAGLRGSSPGGQSARRVGEACLQPGAALSPSPAPRHRLPGHSRVDRPSASHLDVRELAQVRVHGQQRLVHQLLVVIHPEQVIVLQETRTQQRAPGEPAHSRSGSHLPGTRGPALPHRFTAGRLLRTSAPLSMKWGHTSCLFKT